MGSFRSVSLGVLLLVLVTVASAAFARTINVPTGQPTIQAAINAAANGDVVVVAKGTYHQRINFSGKAITVRSTNPADKTVVAATIIDGSKMGSVVTFKSGEPAGAALRGFTVTNGRGTGLLFGVNDWEYYGGGVYCENSSPTLANNIITGNTALSVMNGAVSRLGEGGGVYCKGASPTLIGNTISDNSTNGSGGGVYCLSSAPTLTKNTISDNSSTDLSGGGGGVYCSASSPTLTSNTISANSARRGGGVCCQDASSAVLTNNTLSNNTAFSGGGVFCYSSSPILTNNLISGNLVTGYGGGGVYCVFSSPTLNQNTINANTSTDGGGVYCLSSTPALTNNTISGNTAERGGGVACTNYVPVLTNNLISSNTAQVGGGMYCENSSALLTNNTLVGNSATAGRGGGVCCNKSASPILKNNILALNTSGGGLYVQVDPIRPSSPVVTYCNAWSNTDGNYVNLTVTPNANGNLSKDPLFANAAAGDFHEKSKGGRWNPATRAWVKDTVQSPCINKGDPASPFALEPAPNGGRINLGAYGNTAQASKSAPVAPVGSLQVSAAAAPVSGDGAQLSVNLSAAASVEVTITNLAGRAIAALPTSDLPQGVSTLLWSGRGASGLRVPSGTYLARLTARTEDGAQGQTLAVVSLQR